MRKPSQPPDAFCLVMTTTASEAEAETMARQIVQARLAACVQVQAIKSFYVWKEQPCAEKEWLLLIKSRAVVYQALEDFIRAHHRYETPEIVQLPITAGSADYLHWLALQTGA
ncbi:MAG: divalent-cation tolerance protein CutA [Curvibacter sp. PD_MW3]|nr:divalent-cation tolerance protein CutA [Burkholderiales bacterium]PHM20084.1 MAG: divalent-cation tolerance protein CutA [Curvibacter sp. PD_MW3]